MFKYFHPETFDKGRESVVGVCNGLTMEKRWSDETPLFGKAISHLVPPNGKVLDYGCGVGRLSKAIIDHHDTAKVLGFDNSETQIKHAVKYVKDAKRFVGTDNLNFITTNAPFDLVVCVYVLQHVRSIDLREVINTLAESLSLGGYLVYCSSERRMAVADDGTNQGFFDDGFLGVDVLEELRKRFSKVRDLFSLSVLEKNDTLRKMIKGVPGGIAHPAILFRRSK